ncbi:MAG: hypothetical protein WAT21_08170 [Saprospiraceae bacterium]
MKKESTLSIMDKMVKENNQGIMLSTTITDVRFVKQGAIIAFGVPEEIGKCANTQIVIGSSDYMFMCFVVKKSEIEKYRAGQIEP